MTDLSIPNVFVSGTSIVAADMNANFDAVKTLVNTTGVPKLQSGVALANLDAASVTADKLASGVSSDDPVRISSAAGTSIKAMTFDPRLATSSLQVLSGLTRWAPVWLPAGATITGVAFVQQQQGVYTANNTSQVGLYTLSGTTLTRVAASANNATLWKQSAGACWLEPFSSTYVASAGLYYIAWLYNSSAQTTVPQLAASATMAGSGVASFGSTTGTAGVFHLQGTGSDTSLPSSITVGTNNATEAVRSSQGVPLLGLY